MTVQDKLKFHAYVSVGFLLKSYEAYYFLKCIEAKKYEKNYMDKIGFFEEKVLKAELDVEILEKKRELMQTAINRHEPLDMKNIEKQLMQYRKQLLEQPEDEGPDEDEKMQMKILNYKLRTEFHPDTHPDFTDSQKKLYDMAQTAYHFNSLKAMEVIYRMLASDMKYDIMQLLNMRNFWEADLVKVAEEINRPYELVDKMVKVYEQKKEDDFIKQNIENCEEDIAEALAEVYSLKEEFPFNTVEMLADEKLLADFKKELEHRLFEAGRTKERLEGEIKDMEANYRHV